MADYFYSLEFAARAGVTEMPYGWGAAMDNLFALRDEENQ